MRRDKIKCKTDKKQSKKTKRKKKGWNKQMAR